MKDGPTTIGHVTKKNKSYKTNLIFKMYPCKRDFFPILIEALVLNCLGGQIPLPQINEMNILNQANNQYE